MRFDSHRRPTAAFPRRELLRLGGGSLLGFGLADLLRANSAHAFATLVGKPRTFGIAKNLVLVFLQGGPSHLDLWDPKENVPDDVKSVFKTIPAKVPGMEVTELLPELAKVTDRFTFIRSMAYSPIGLFNHTAAHYQMLTGYTADKVSPSGQLDPPSPKDFPTLGSHVVRLRPPEAAMLPFVMLPRPLQESNVIGKAGTAGFLGREFDPYTLYPPGDDTDETKMDRVNASDLELRSEVSVSRLERRARLKDEIDAAMPAIEKAVASYGLDAYAEKALSLVLSGRARAAFDLEAESAATRDRYGRTTFGQSLLLARRFIEAGTRVVQVNWPKVANSDLHSWDMHTGLPERIRDRAAPMFDRGFSAFLEDLDARGMLDETLVVAVGEFGRSPRKGLSTSGNDNDAQGRDHWPYCFTAIVAGGGMKRGYVHGKSDATGSAPIEKPVHPTELLSTIYHALGIDPLTIVHNHLNQPRELVQGLPVTELFA